MLWEFEELGYDVAINSNGRTGAKPIRWSYFTDSLQRRQLYQTYANLIALKKRPAFAAGVFSGLLGGQTKVIHLTGPALNVTVIGNFGLAAASVDPNFQATGRWYNYLSGDSITVAGANDLITLPPGGYAVYTDHRLVRATTLGTRAGQASNPLTMSVAPNPATAGRALVTYTLPTAGAATLTVQNLLGQTVYAAPVRWQTAGPQAQEVPVATLPAGMYLVRMQVGTLGQTTRLLVQP